MKLQIFSSYRKKRFERQKVKNFCKEAVQEMNIRNHSNYFIDQIGSQTIHVFSRELFKF